MELGIMEWRPSRPLGLTRFRIRVGGADLLYLNLKLKCSIIVQRAATHLPLSQLDWDSTT